jgi:hypothetical protein
MKPQRAAVIVERVAEDSRLCLVDEVLNSSTSASLGFLLLGSTAHQGLGLSPILACKFAQFGKSTGCS